MDGDITGHKRQSISHFKALMAERSGLPFSGDTQGRFMNQLQRHPGIDFCGLFASPATKEIPGAEAQVLRDKHPDAGEVTRNLVTKDLANLSFNTGRITGHHAASALGFLGFNLGRSRQGKLDVEFFFEGRIQR